MEIQERNVIEAYKTASDSEKNLLRTMFPAISFEPATEADMRPVTERVTNFDEAVEELSRRASTGDELASDLLNDYENLHESATPDLVAYIKLRIVVAALNDGWEPQFTQEEERWYVWHLLWTADELSNKSDEWKRERHLMPVDDYRQEGWAGFAFSYSNLAPSCTYTSLGSRLCFKDEPTARYAATTFIDLWADFGLIRR